MLLADALEIDDLGLPPPLPVALPTAETKTAEPKTDKSKVKISKRSSGPLSTSELLRTKSLLHILSKENIPYGKNFRVHATFNAARPDNQVATSKVVRTDYRLGLSNSTPRLMRYRLSYFNREVANPHKRLKLTPVPCLVCISATLNFLDM